MTDQQLLSESRNLVKKISDERNIPKFRELIEEFVEKYEIYPNLTEVLRSLESERTVNKKKLIALKKKALKEIQKTYNSLVKKCKVKKINIPLSITDAYKQKTISSSEYTTSKFSATRDLVLFLKNHGETSLVKKLAIFISIGGIYKCTISPIGGIYECTFFPFWGIDECTFSPSYTKWHKEREAAKKSAWYSFDQIMYLKNNVSNFLFIEDYPLENDDRYSITKSLCAVMLSDPQETMTRYKLCTKILHNYAKSVLIKKEKRPSAYDKKTGVLVINTIKISFNPVQLRGKILAFLYQKGKQRTMAIPFDEIYDKTIKTKADDPWDILEPSDREKIKKQIFEIYKGINDRVTKQTKKPFLTANNLTLHFA